MTLWSETPPAVAATPVVLAGLRTRVALSADHVAPAALPAVFSSDTCASCLRGELAHGAWPPAAHRTVVAVASAMRESRHGLLLALLELPGAPRPLALVQSDRGRYVAHHRSPGGQVRIGRRRARRSWPRPTGPVLVADPPPGDGPDVEAAPAWAEFYTRAGAALFDRADRAWGAREVVISHAPESGWPGHSLPRFLVGLAAAVTHRRLTVERVRFLLDGCGVASPQTLEWAHGFALDAPTVPLPQVRRLHPRRIGLPATAGLELLQVRDR